MGAEPGDVIRDVERVAVRPGDVVALHLRQHLDEKAIERLREQLRVLWPENPVVVLDVDLELTVFEWE